MIESRKELELVASKCVPRLSQERKEKEKGDEKILPFVTVERKVRN